MSNYKFTPVIFLLFILLQVPEPSAAQTGQDSLDASAAEETVQTADTVSQVNPAVSDDADAQVEDTGSDSRLGEIRELISFSVIFLTLFILVITYFLNRLIVQILDNISEKSARYRLFTKRLVPIVRIAIWSFSLYIIIAGIIDPPFETVLTVTASIGIAIGFASQDILKNVFGGFIIILDRPFQVGDKIQVGEYYGEVLQIGLRSCRIVTPDDSVVTIPNGELMNKAVSNANSSALDCQVVAEIYLPADIDVELVKRIAYKAAISSRYAYLKKPVSVIAKNEIHEKNFVIKLRVKAYVLDIRYEFPFQSDMTELILSELNERKLIPSHFPQAT